MKLYHGTYRVEHTPHFGMGNVDNDYGEGLYTTPDKESALEWALTNGDDHAFVEEYNLNTEGLNILNLDDYGPLAWIAELLDNRDMPNLKCYESEKRCIIRDHKIDTSKADIIIGYRAGEGYRDVLESFLAGEINLDEIVHLFKMQDLGPQVFIKSKKAFEALTQVEREDVSHLDTPVKSTAPRKVKAFLAQRKIAIELENYEPSGLIALEVATQTYEYNKEYNFYQMIPKENTMKEVIFTPPEEIEKQIEEFQLEL